MKIVLIGSGNVASHLGQALNQQGQLITQVYSYTKANASALALRFPGARATADLKDISPDADLYIIAVTDAAMPAVIQALPAGLPGIVVHCSGATDIAVLEKFNYAGVIYPPQSISKQLDLNMQAIPFCVEGNTPQTQEILLQLTQTFAPEARACDSAQRLTLHLCAVLVNNFPNILFQMAYELMAEQQLPFDLLKPIILETARKVQNAIPQDVQTGPAKRNDQNTIHKHLEFLSQKNEIAEIYQLLTTQIVKRNK